jgi:GntR family transcriptional regulator, arabinose operon transcriptional repressor
MPISELFDRLPKYVQIKEALRKDIEEGYLKAGQQISAGTSSIERFSASRMTVIRAMQELEQEGYLRRIQGKGTYVTHPQQRAPLIGVLASCVDRDVFPIIAQGIENQARRLGYKIIFSGAYEDQEEAASFVSHLAVLRASGAIAVPDTIAVEHADLLWFNQCRQYDIPMVLVGQELKNDRKTPVVQTNNEEAMAQLTQDVIQRGHRRILLVCHETPNGTSVVSRTRGFQRMIEQFASRVDFSETVVINEKRPLDVNRTILQAWIQEFEPSVLMAVDDPIAVDVIRMLRLAPEHIRSRISITGFDDLPYSDVLGLTTVHRPLREEGEKSVEMLHALISGKPVKSEVIPSRVIHRSSLTEWRVELSGNDRNPAPPAPPN